jgi:hypothetical protein
MGQWKHLTALFALDEKAQSNAEIAECHYHQPGAVLAGAARNAAHAFAAVPYGIALEQRLYGIVVAGLHNRYYLPWIVAVKLRRRANGSTGPTIDTGMETLLEPIVLIQFFKIIHSHSLRFAGGIRFRAPFPQVFWGLEAKAAGKTRQNYKKLGNCQKNDYLCTPLKGTIIIYQQTL